MYTLGVDIGGTFTDLVLFDEERKSLTTTKVPSTPGDEAKAVFEGLKELGINPEEILRIVHGMTVATNAILQRKGAKVALVTTRGFRDTIEIGRTRRMDPRSLFNIKFIRPKPLVPRSLRFEIGERTLYNGQVLHPVREEEVQEVSEKIRVQGVDVVAICFLHSYINNENERTAGKILKKYLPGILVSLSSEVVPEYREFERFTTTTLNCFVMPVMEHYLKNLKEGFKKQGYRKEIFIMASNGGVVSSDSARKFPATTLLSGPAGGVNGGIFVAEKSGLKNIITYDMGGTSTDVCLIRDFRPSISTERVISGLPIKLPQVGVNTVGAGGGSIAWVDIGEILKVGPQSAGAFPGPACYGSGGTEATVTDANVVLNRITSRIPLAGKVLLHPDLAKKAISKLTTTFKVSDEYRMAEGIIQIAVAKMIGSIREISLEKGHDPRDYIIMPFGGAGPMHAIPIASGLGIKKCLVPRYPGNLSALGLLISEIKYDFVKTRISPLKELEWNEIQSYFQVLKGQAKSHLEAQGFSSNGIRFLSSIDMRYIGQAFEVNIPVFLESGNLKTLEEDFHRIYEETYGHVHKAHSLEIVNFRLSVIAEVKKPPLARYQSPTQLLKEAEIERRSVYFEGEFYDCPIYHRDLLPQGISFSGPTIVEEPGATTVVFPSWKASIDEWGNILMEEI
jgi:N-methylhydantoinase A